MEVTHTYEDAVVHLTLFHAGIAGGRPRLLEHTDMRWITPAEISHYPFCPADAEILEKLQTGGIRPVSYTQLDVYKRQASAVQALAIWP